MRNALRMTHQQRQNASVERGSDGPKCAEEKKQHEKKQPKKVLRPGQPSSAPQELISKDRRRRAKTTREENRTASEDTREERGERPTSSYPTRPASPLVGWYALCMDNTPRNASKRGVVTRRAVSPENFCDVGVRSRVEKFFCL